jgi:hypothetical protein
LLPGIDGRSAWVRRAKDIIALHLSDLGGFDNTSAAERSIVRRASTLTVNGLKPSSRPLVLLMLATSRFISAARIRFVACLKL